MSIFNSGDGPCLKCVGKKIMFFFPYRDTMSSIPRLTGALRAFANVSSSAEKSVADQHRELALKRQMMAKKHTDTVSWARLKEVISKEADVSKPEVEKALKELSQYAKAIGTCITRHLYWHIKYHISYMYVFYVYWISCTLLSDIYLNLSSTKK